MKTGRIVPKSDIGNRVNAPQGELLHAGGAKDGPSNGSSAGARKGIESAITLPSQGRGRVVRSSERMNVLSAEIAGARIAKCCDRGRPVDNPWGRSGNITPLRTHRTRSCQRHDRLYCRDASGSNWALLTHRWSEPFDV